MNRCKDCWWWGGSDGPKTERIRLCPCHSTRVAMMVYVPEDGLFVGPDFGCVHWEAKPPAPRPDGGEKS